MYSNWSPHIIPATVSISTSIWPLDIWLSAYPYPCPQCCPTTHRRPLYNKRLLSCSSGISDISCVVLGEAALPPPQRLKLIFRTKTNDLRKVTNIPNWFFHPNLLKMCFSTCLLAVMFYPKMFPLRFLIPSAMDLFLPGPKLPWKLPDQEVPHCYWLSRRWIANLSWWNHPCQRWMLNLNPERWEKRIS